MKERKWISFKTAVYVCLAAASMMLCLFIYFVLLQTGIAELTETYTLIALSSLFVQIAFNILNIRLIHFYLLQVQSPGALFNTWHRVLLILNSCVALTLMYLFLFGFADSFEIRTYRRGLTTEDMIVLLIVGIYTFLTIYTITGSIQLRFYLKKYISYKEESWLNELGNKPV